MASEKTTAATIGIDISKDHLDAFRLEDRAAQRFGNSARGFRALLRWLGQTPVARIVHEPTGPWHRAFEVALSGGAAGQGQPASGARRFAEAPGTRAETDATAARMLARMGAALKLEPDAPMSRNLSVLRDLQTARAALVKERTRPVQPGPWADAPDPQTPDQGTPCPRPAPTRRARGRGGAPHRPRRGPRAQALHPAAGPAALILTLLPEIGTLPRAQAASLAGLAPHVRDSAQWKGRSFIGGGRNPLRQALCMPALVAMRFPPDLKRKCEGLRAAGKPAKVALVAFGGAAVHRKAALPASRRTLPETANALVRANRLRPPKPA